MLIKQVHHKSVLFLKLYFKFQQNICKRCHDLLMMSINLSHIAILNIKECDSCEMKKTGKLSIKNRNMFIRIYKNGKSYTIWWYWNPKKNHQYKEHISIKNRYL